MREAVSGYGRLRIDQSWGTSTHYNQDLTSTEPTSAAFNWPTSPVPSTEMIVTLSNGWRRAPSDHADASDLHASGDPFRLSVDDIERGLGRRSLRVRE